jgi:hypothetical protein
VLSSVITLPSLSMLPSRSVRVIASSSPSPFCHYSPRPSLVCRLPRVFAVLATALALLLATVLHSITSKPSVFVLSSPSRSRSSLWRPPFSCRSSTRVVLHRSAIFHHCAGIRRRLPQSALRAALPQHEVHLGALPLAFLSHLPSVSVLRFVTLPPSVTLSSLITTPPSTCSLAVIVLTSVLVMPIITMLPTVVTLSAVAVYHPSRPSVLSSIYLLPFVSGLSFVFVLFATTVISVIAPPSPSLHHRAPRPEVRTAGCFSGFFSTRQCVAFLRRSSRSCYTSTTQH